MEQPLARVRTELVVGPAADVRLDQIVGVRSSRRDVFVPVMNAARHGFNSPGSLAAKQAPGLRAWLDGHEELRIRLSRAGWQIPQQTDLNGAGFVLSSDGRTAICMVSGDGSTGRGAYSPQVRYPRGDLSTDIVQGVLFEQFDDEKSTIEHTWFLLHHVTAAGWHAELARPVNVDSRGWVSGWHERVEVLEDRLAVDDELARVPEPDLPAPTVRWRDSA